MLREKHFRQLLISLCIIGGFLFLLINKGISVKANEDLSNRKVLFISSYSEDFMSVPDQRRGVEDILTSLGIEVNFEYMDSKRFDTVENYQLFYDLIRYKLSMRAPYDGIIVGDDNALQFALVHKEELFPDTPITFLGINDLRRARKAAEDPYITGVVEETSMKENIEIASKFNPKATKVLAIVDGSLTGRGNRQQFHTYEKDFPHLQFSNINVSNYSFDELGEVLESIDEDTIILYFSMYVDKNGVNITIPEAIKILKEHIPYPIYRSEIGGVGQGILGGKMISYYESGKIAASMLVEVFLGTPIETIDMVDESPNYYTFDYALLKEYGINLRLLPKNSILINKEPTFYEENKTLVLRTLTFIGVLLLIIIIVTYDNMKRRIIEKKLQESHEELTQAFEEVTAQEEELRTQYEVIQNNIEEINLLNHKYNVAIEGTNSAVWELNLVDETLEYSSNSIHMVEDSLITKITIRQLHASMEEKNSKKLEEEFTLYINGEKEELNIELDFMNQEGEVRWMLIRGKGIPDENGTINIIHGITLDITELKEKEILIEHMAKHDTLTDLPNRQAFMEKLGWELKEGNKGAVLLMDINNFKRANDTLGHVFGDGVLKEAGRRMSALCNDNYQIFRFGGDEFLVLIKEDDRKVIETYISQTLGLFEKPINLNGREYSVTFSIGISLYPSDSDNIEQILMNSDISMYHAKRIGRNSYIFYNEQIQQEITKQAKIEEILQRALKEDGFVLYYQPQVNITSGEIIGFEALIRLKNHAIPPDVFIGVAESEGLINEVGRWVTKEAIRQIAVWREEGKEMKPVSINFSWKQISDLGYYDYVVSLLERYNVSPEYLVIEMTESILIGETESTLSLLEDMRKLGIKLALDDFGTGFSSLNYLTYLPMDKIKLDKSLCEKFLNGATTALKDLISFIHSLNFDVIAEGIEEEEQVIKLKDSGCDCIQGYFFSKPLPPSQLEDIYDRNMLKNKF